MADTINSNIELDEVFGYPPSSYVSDDMITNSMPIVQILPGKPNFSSGLTLFRINTVEGFKEYQQILGKHGFSLKTKAIQLAFIADNFPTDSFTNEYGETFLQKFTDVASQGMQQLAQITNSQSGTDMFRNLGGAIDTATKGMDGAVASMLRGGADAMTGIAGGLEKLKSNISNQSNFLGGALNSIDKMLAGHRVDFPMIWRNSGFTPSYTITVRLYNPKPGSRAYTKKYIAGPLAAILCLAIPQSTDGKTFQWPFFHRIRCAGVYNLEPAVITNVTVVKGGDQQQISFRQSLSMVDVRIDFTSLYSTMVVEKDATFESERPTVRRYIDSLTDWDDSLIVTRQGLRNSGNRISANTTGGPNITVSAIPTVNQAQQNSLELALSKNAAAKRRQAPTVTDVPVTDRVPASTVTKQNTLAGESNPDFVSV